MPGVDFSGIPPVVSIPLRITVFSISPITATTAIRVTIAAGLSVATHSPVGAHLMVIATHFATQMVAVTTAHHPIMPHGSIIVFRPITIGSLILLVLRILIGLCGN